ncbi:MAG: F0F1 ATP synthase subunit B family protein [Croceibacterium sp.]
MLDILAAAGDATEPTAFGLNAGGWVAVAMIVVIVLGILAGAPRIIAGILDSRIEGIRKQLDEAKALRAEAEKLRDEYAKKAREADAEVAVLHANAERQAEEIVEKAKADAAALIERHKVIACEKIASAERAAVDELRAKVASAAAAAARELIAQKHGEAADRKLADQIISNI